MINPVNPLTKKILLIGWDGADWEHINPLLEEGLMPTLEGMINDGVKGNLATLQPVLSPMLWNSVATGKLAHKHGIHGFTEPDPINGGARPYTSLSRKCKALWNIFTQQNMRSNVVGWWASHPAEPINGCVVSNSFSATTFNPEKGWSVVPGTIHPEEKIERLAPMRVMPSEFTEQHILPFIPNAAEIDQEKDQRFSSFTKVLGDCATIQSLATTIMEDEPWDFTAVYFDAIDHFCHAFMQYYPPKLSHISEKDFDMYKDVIKGAYRFHDMMLERQLQLAGDDCTVILCSDHGFQSRHLRPKDTPREPAGPAAWHRDLGMIVMKGPGIKKDELVFGASLIDIAPTILSLYGLPIGEDMDGRPLIEAFEQNVDPQVIPSWEDVPGECGMHPPGTEMDKRQSNELIQQFVALGYVEDAGDDKEKAADNADTEGKYNVARTLLWSRKYEEGIELLEELVHRRPWETRFVIQLATSYHDAGYHQQCINLISETFPEDKETPANVLMVKSKAFFAMKDHDEGLRLALMAEKKNLNVPGIFTQIGQIFYSQRRFEDAERSYLKAIEIHDESASAYQGLASVYLKQQRNEEAAENALNAVGILHRLPKAHYYLGVAMARLGWPERASQAFQTALRINPKMIRAHRMLATLYKQDGSNPQAALQHQERVRILQMNRGKERAIEQEKENKLFELPPIPNAEEREEILKKQRPDKKKKRKKSGKTFTLVSGLPRSGTSLMMQMLTAGGMEPKTDGLREADTDNPEGYYEWEDIKKVAKQPELMDEEGLDGKVIKSVSMLLQSMPDYHNYKVIFMVRPIEEIAASQKKMIDRLGTEGADLDYEQLVNQLTTHREFTLKGLKGAEYMEVLEIDFPSLVQSPESQVEKIVEFLGEDRITNPQAMPAAVRPDLHRQKSENASAKS